MISDVKENMTYEFQFDCYDNNIEIKDNITSIFENSEVVTINKSNKKGSNKSKSL